MSSSLPQPLVAYPHSISEPSSTGSFGPVFIVLAVIAVLATSACIIGRLCAPRLCQPKDPMACTHAKGDMEDGFGLTISTARRQLTNLLEMESSEDQMLSSNIKSSKGTKGDAKLSAANVGAKPSK